MKISIKTIGLLLAGLFIQLAVFAEPGQPNDKKYFGKLLYETVPVDSELALEYAKKLEDLALEDRDTAYLVYALNAQGIVYNRYLNFAASEQVLRRSYKLNPDYYHVVFNLANTYRLAGNEQKALLFYQKALDTDSPRQSLIYSHIGLLYLRKGNMGQAEKYFDMEMESALSATDSIIAYLNWAYYFLEDENYPETERYLTTASEQLEKLDKGYAALKFTRAAIHENWGKYYLETGNIPQAEKHFIKALDIAEKLHLGLVLQECYKGMQRVAVQLKNDETFQYFYEKEQAFRQENSRQLNAFHNQELEREQQKVILEALQTQQAKNEKGFAIWWGATATITLAIIALLLRVLYRRNKQHKEDVEYLREKVETLQNRFVERLAEEEKAEEEKGNIP